jgi:hypothetical protein
MLEEYLFVYNDKDGSFPVRLRIIREGDGSTIPDLAELTGTVNKADVENFRAELEKKYPKPVYNISRAWANTWKAVEHNYAGLDYEYDSPSSNNKDTTYSKPETGPQELGEVLFETSATSKTRTVFLLGTVMFFGALAVLWPDFSARYGSFYSWFLTLIYNPVYALGGLIVPASLVAGVITFFRFVYYLRVKVRLHEHGIQMQPGNRSVRWDEVEHLCYARRSLRYYGFPLPVRQSLSLQVSGKRPIKLPHRFNMMEYLVSLVREHIEPFLLGRAVKRLRAEGSVSFGKQVTVTRENLMLKDLKVSIPLKQVDRIDVHGGTFQVVGLNNRVIFSRAVELIPDATIIPELLTLIKE